jgi:hypothetical protein
VKNEQKKLIVPTTDVTLTPEKRESLDAWTTVRKRTKKVHYREDVASEPSVNITYAPQKKKDIQRNKKNITNGNNSHSFV